MNQWYPENWGLCFILWLQRHFARNLSRINLNVRKRKWCNQVLSYKIILLIVAIYLVLEGRNIRFKGLGPMCNSFNMNYPSLYTDEYIHVTFIINNVLYVSTILISEAWPFAA